MFFTLLALESTYVGNTKTMIFFWFWNETATISGCFCGYMFEILPLTWKKAQKVLLETHVCIYLYMLRYIYIYLSTLSMLSSCVRVLLTFSCGHILVATFCMFLLSRGIYRCTMWFSFTNKYNLFWCLTFASVSMCLIFYARRHHRRNP